MEVKLIDLLNSKNALNEVNDLSLKALYSFKVKKIITMVNDELTMFQEMFDEKRKILLEDIDENGKPAENKTASFNDEINEATQAIVILDFEKINLSWFAKSNGKITDETEWHDFTPKNFQILSWLIFDNVS